AAIADAVVVMDREGRITCWAGASERLFGVSAAEAIGQRATVLFPRLLGRDPIEMATLGRAARLEMVGGMPGNGPPIAGTCTPVREEQGNPVGTTAMIRLMGGCVTPAEGAGRPRRQWHRTLGSIIQEMVDGAGEDPSAMDASDALARMLIGQARRLLP